MAKRKKYMRSTPKAEISVLLPMLGNEDDINLFYHPLDGIPLVAHTLRGLNSAAVVKEIIVLTYERDLMRIADICHQMIPDKQKLVLCAARPDLELFLQGALSTSSEIEYIAISSPLYPFITADVLNNALDVAKKRGAAIAGIPVKDTVKIVEGNRILQTPERATLYTLQPPEIIQSDLLKAALTKAIQQGVATTDIARVLQTIKLPFALSHGDEKNICIADIHDIPKANAVLAWRATQ